MNIENPFVNCAHPLIDFIETGRYTNIPRNVNIKLHV